MEKLEIGEVAQLENGKEYICCSKVIDGVDEYLYLMSNFKPLEIKFAKQDIVNGELQLTIIGDQEKKQRLLELFKSSFVK